MVRRSLASFEVWGVLVCSIVVIVALPVLNALMDSTMTAGDFKDVPGLAAKLAVGHADVLDDSAAAPDSGSPADSSAQPAADSTAQPAADASADQAAQPAATPPAQPAKTDDPVSEFIWQQIPDDEQKILADPKSTTRQKQAVLVEIFNKIVQGDPVYDAERFAGVTLSPETLKLKSRNPTGEDLKWLNRLLLDDFYSHELKKATYTAVPGWMQVSNYSINLYGQFLCYAMVAISVDLLWGYTGLLSLGQCLFFSLGGYMFGMYLMRMIGSLGSYKKPIPDFLCMQGWQHLPSIWRPFSSFPFALMMTFLLPGVLSLVFGFLAFRSRIRGVYFAILTQALTYAATILFYRNEILLGGNNGFTDFKFMLGYNLLLAATQRWLYIASGVALLAVYLFCKWLTTTKYGKIQRAIRDSETRVLFSGYATANYKLFVFVLSGLIAALAGMLYVPQIGSMNPSEMGPDKSIEAVVWVAVGGRGTLVGPIIGAIAVNWLKSWATHAYPDIWLIFLGLLFILVVLFMPKGLVGLFGQVRDLFRKREAGAESDAGPKTIAKTESPTALSKADL